MFARVKHIFSIKNEITAGRVELLDFLRGAGMMLVLLHHSDMPYCAWLLLFHMPCLFVLSGYTLSICGIKRDFWSYLKNRVMRLVVPYFLFEGVNLFVWSASLILQGGWQDLSEAVIAIVTCVNTEGYMGYYGRLWFLPCMFVSDILFYFIYKVRSRINHKLGRKLFLLLCAGMLLGLSWITARMIPGRLPFASDTALMATFFLLAGFFFGDQISWLLNHKYGIVDILIFCVSILLLRKSGLSGQAFCGMYENTYGHYGYTLAAAFSGTLAFLVGSKWLYRLVCKIGIGKNLILWYGRNSLITFPIHLSIKMWMWNHIPWGYRPWYVLLAVMLVVNIPIVNVITQYFPFMLGKFPSHNEKKQK